MEQKIIQIMVKEIPIYARVCNTPESRQQGLMGVEKLEPNEGCLFIFDQPQEVGFWMRNCKIDLQAVMCDEEKNICSLHDMFYQDPYQAHRSTKPILYVLEMPANFFTTNNIGLDDKLIFDY